MRKAIMKRSFSFIYSFHFTRQTSLFGMLSVKFV